MSTGASNFQARTRGAGSEREFLGLRMRNFHGIVFI